ncbi:Netrin receptor DCC [Schistosoma japonicum]|nr:Netrin receptor DCC [Schistosoma japonicum]
MNKSNYADDDHNYEIPLLLLRHENVLFLCGNCSQNNTITVVQTINSTLSFTQLFVIDMQTSLEVENKFQQLFTLPSVNITAFCSVNNVALNEREQNNYTLIRKNVSSTYRQIHSKAEQIELSRRKRSSVPKTNDIYSTIHSQLLPPRNLQIVPLNFGSLNISWIPAKVNEQYITHYELILFSLNEKPDSLYDHCFRTYTKYNHTGHHVYLAPLSSQNRQVFINVTAPADYAVITGLPPDNFYRVLLFAVGNSLRSPPATMPSSPRVPALSPQTPPDGIKVTPRGTQSAKISWNPPGDVDCMGELMNYVININSSRLIEPIIIKVPRSKRSHIVENLIPGTFYTVQVSASTRGGLGVPSKSVHFQTGGELPKLDTDELEGIQISKSNLESNMGSLNVDFFEEETKVDELVDSIQQPSTSPLYVLPSRIVSEILGDLIQNVTTCMLLNNIFILWKFDIHAKINLFKSENILSSYLLFNNLKWNTNLSSNVSKIHFKSSLKRPGTIYYIRVISVTEGGDGPAAYTVVMTQDSSAATKPTNQGLLIPVNLVVLQLGSTWARVGWDIPHIPQSIKMSISGFQVKYYSVKTSLDQEEYDGRQESEMEMTNSITEQFTTKSVEDKKYELKMINMTLLPNQILAEHFDIVLRDLKPATQYEFGVRMLHSEVLSEESNPDNDDRTVKTYFWSMVQGFETFGKSPKDAPKNIRLSKLRLNNKLQTKLQLLDFSSIHTSSIIHRDEIHDQNDNDNNNPGSHFLVTMYIKWDPPNYPNGKILASAVYLTTNTKQSTRKWIERSVNGGSTEAGLLRLQPSTLYFVKINARNQHGRSPSSNIIAFYTPNVILFN